jgi:hypothetical protein
MQESGITARTWTNTKRQSLYEASGLSRNFAERTLEYTKPLRSFHTASAASGLSFCWFFLDLNDCSTLVDSTDQCNTLVKSLGWCFIV